MPFSIQAFPEAANSDHRPYVLGGATVPVAVVEGVADLPAARDGLLRLDIGIERGRISSIRPAGTAAGADGPEVVDIDRGMVLPATVDMHTHLDKGHIWPRRPNANGRFETALAACRDERIEGRWTAQDLSRRMDFSLRSAYAHGTRVIRTHLDSVPPQDLVTWPVFAELREAWRGRIELQGVSLVGPDTLMDRDALGQVAETVRRHGGALGAAIAVWPDARTAIENLVSAADQHGLDLDVHVDETEDPASSALLLLAEEVLARRFPGRVVAGHCCSLARQDDETVDRTLDLVAEARIGVVSLPMCNMYLQDRQMAEAAEHRRTPRWRGVTLLHEMKARGIPVAVASDNTRDPFYAYGDLDGLEVLREATRICHLDHATSDFAAVTTRAPADIIGATGQGRIRVGLDADLVLLRARSWTELFARPHSDRVVLRSGIRSRAELPDYRELDDLFGEEP